MNLDSIIALDQRITLWINSFNSPLSDSFWVFMSDTKIWFPAYGVVMGVMIWRLGWKKGLLMILAMILTVVAADQISAHIKDSVMPDGKLEYKIMELVLNIQQYWKLREIIMNLV